MKSESVAITLTAIFSKATTTVDGGWRISFDVSQDQAAQVMMLASVRDSLVQLAVVQVED